MGEVGGHDGTEGAPRALPPGLARSPLPSGVVDAGGRWSATNDALRSLLGDPPPGFSTLVDEPGVLAGGALTSIDGAALRLCLPDGSSAEGLVTALDDGAWLVQVLDRRERDELEDRLHDAIAAFETFVSRVSHDLRNPIGTALGFAELLLATADLGEDARGFAERVRSSAERAAAIITELVAEARSTSRIDPPDEVDVGAVVEQVRADLAPLVARRGADIQVTSTLPRIRSDARVVHRALLAAVRNAVEHHPGAARVEVSAVPAARGWELRIDDDGPGLSAGEREAVVLPGRTVSGGGGAGLGLSLARAAVERRGGTLELDEHRATGGVRVRILLPQRRASDPAPAG